MTTWSRGLFPTCPGRQHEQEMNFYALKSLKCWPSCYSRTPARLTKAGLLGLGSGSKRRTFLSGSSRSQQCPAVRLVRGPREEHYVFGQKVQILGQNLRKSVLLPKFNIDSKLKFLCPGPGTAMHPPPQHIHSKTSELLSTS